MLHINELTHRFGSRVIFNNASVHVPKGHRVGVVGPNGSGKSTLFQLIANELSPDSGDIKLLGKSRLGRVLQEAPASEKSLIETVLEADKELTKLESQAKKTQDPSQIAQIQLRLTDIGAHTAKARAARILAGLGFSEDQQGLSCESFSGGWRMRVAIAATLFSRPDLLLLDEPTNHLDLESSLWLENYLEKFSGTLLIISHDRALLNRSVEHIMLLEQKTLKLFSGSYDRFEKTRALENALQEASNRKKVKERERIQSFVDRFRAKATKARQAQSRLKKLSKMEPVTELSRERENKFSFPLKTTLPSPIINMESIACGYGDTTVLENLELQIGQDDRIALLGANGNGKSTLIKLMAGRINPLSGGMNRSKKLRIGYFSQHQTEELEIHQTAYQILSNKMINDSESRVRALLGSFGFQGSRGDVQVKMLSGGEKARLLFCLLSYDQPHILLLDEPTNHLDIDARQALVKALNDFQGAIVLVSHDIHILDLVVDQLWIVGEKTCKVFDGDLDDYRQIMLGGITKNKKKDFDSQSIKNSKNSKLIKRQQRAAERKHTANLRKSLKDAEVKLELASIKVAELEASLANPEIYQGSTYEMLRLTETLAVAREELSFAEAKWLDVEEKLDLEIKNS